MRLNDTWEARARKIAAARARLETAERKRRIATRQRQMDRAARNHKRRCS